jgi:serine/threonine protein kinase
MTNGKFKLNDFNRGHLMYWNTTSNESTCSYKCDIPNPGIQRAPEEIIYSDEQTESIDTWSLGHILHMILTNEYSFDESQIDMEDVQKLILEGKRPKLSKKVRESNHPADRAIMKAIDMCLVQDWRRRYTSVEVRDYLAKELRKIK